MALFEPIGRFFFLKTRIWIFFGLVMSPFLIVLAILALRFMALLETEKAFDAAALRGRAALEKRLEKERFLSRYSNSEPYFVDQHLESLPLMQANLKEHLAMKNHPACRNREGLEKRIAFLESAENRLTFAEENIRSSKRIKETQERLIHPVEINRDDLEHLLSLIEDVSIGPYQPDPRSPQLLIEDFTLTKKDPATYELNLSLMKREFTRVTVPKN